MSAQGFDFAVVGSGLGARVLAGRLAAGGQRRVALIEDGAGSVRLSRGLALAVAPVTRPETLKLAQTGAELQGLFGRSGAGLFVRVRPVMRARAGAAADALRHARHALAGLGYLTEPVNAETDAPGDIAFAVNDALALSRRGAARYMPDWLRAQGVTSFAAPVEAVRLGRDGSFRLLAGPVEASAARTILADDTAVAALAPELERNGVLVAIDASALVTEPVPALPEPLGFAPDLGLVWQQQESRAVEILGAGSPDELAGRFALRVPAAQDWHRAGQSQFRRLYARDGGGLGAQAGKNSAFVMTGFGALTAFLAPAFARVIAQTASEAEAAYFAARGAGDRSARIAAADWIAEAVAQ